MLVSEIFYLTIKTWKSMMGWKEEKMKIGYNYVRDALLRIKESTTYKKFVERDRLCRIKGTHNVTDFEKKEFESSEMEVLMAVREFVMLILGIRIARNKAWKNKAVYTKKQNQEAEKFFQTLRNQIDIILPEFADSFKKRRDQIEREIYSFSAR